MIELTTERYNELIKKEHSYDVLMEVYKMPHDSNFERADQLMKACGVLNCTTVATQQLPRSEEVNHADCGS